MARPGSETDMTDTCLDIGTIQAFIDGELSHERSAEVSSHMAHCDACSFAYAEAEDEAAIVFPALDREFDTLVPTQRLWNKINDSIALEKSQMPWWQKAWALVAVAIANPSIAVAASVVIVIGAFAVVWMNRIPVPTGDSPTLVAKTSDPVIATTANAPISFTAGSLSEPEVRRSAPQFERASYRPESQHFTVQPAVLRTRPANAADPLAGESSYVSTISALSKTVEDKKDGVLRPSQRTAYERDMAVVDDTISKMRKEVKRNPRNETARQVLYSSYQNKIDLLNSVAQKEELMASIK